MQLADHSDITGILNKNLEKGQESARNCIRRERHRDNCLLEGEELEQENESAKENEGLVIERVKRGTETVP